MTLLNPETRLEDCLDLPLATVLKAKDGMNYIYVGMTKNTSGRTLHFHPELTPATRHRFIGTYALVGGGFRRFPDLANYLKPGYEIQRAE